MYQFIIILILTIILGYLLERFLMSIFGFRIFRLITAPGIIIHELSHVIVAVIFGARIKSFKVFKAEGGEVTYTKPVFSFISQPLISFAPILGCSLILYIIGTLLGLNFESFNLQFSLSDFFGFIGNINWNYQAVIFLYLILSFTSAMAPSKQDLKNAFYGLFFMLIVSILIFYFRPETNIMFLKMGFFYLIGLYMILLSLSISLIFWLIKSGFQKIFFS